MNPFEIVLVDDHEIVLQSLEYRLHDHAGWSVRTSCPSGKELLLELKKNGIPDLILLDVAMDKMDGFAVMQELQRRYPDQTRVLALSMHREYHVVKRMLELGAKGFISKCGPFTELLHAMEQIMTLGFYLSPELSKTMMDEQLHPPSQGMQISKVEEEILRLVCEQLNTREIAERLFLSQHTVNTYRARLLEKTGSKNIAGLVTYALRMGLYRP